MICFGNYNFDSWSRGDTQQFIALGLELKKAGQHVCVAAFENYETFVKSYGLEFYPVKGDVRATPTRA